MSKHVAVLMGGFSAEREVSLVSGAACAKALLEAGYDVATIDVQRDVGALLTRLYPKPDVVFNALHGRYGEDGCIQGLLNILQIPYTHSGLLASSLAMDKPMAKTLFESVGLRCPAHVITTIEAVRTQDPLPRPYVAKPLAEGSSVGVKIVRDGDNEPLFAGSGWSFGEQVMVEPFIAGRELTVSVMGGQALAVTEITTNRGFYDYDAKYEDGGSIHVVPAEIDPDVADEALQMSEKAFEILGCRGVARADFRYDGDDLYLLEINTQPGMTPTSLVPEQAAYRDMSFQDLVVWMVEHAACDG